MQCDNKHYYYLGRDTIFIKNIMIEDWDLDFPRKFSGNYELMLFVSRFSDQKSFTCQLIDGLK